jgi:hypothetical protein
VPKARIRELGTSGLSTGAIAKQLNAEDLTTAWGKPWKASNVWRVVQIKLAS